MSKGRKPNVKSTTKPVVKAEVKKTEPVVAEPKKEPIKPIVKEVAKEVAEKAIPKAKFIPKDVPAAVAVPRVIEVAQVKRTDKPETTRSVRSLQDKISEFESGCLSRAFTREKMSQYAHEIFAGHTIEMAMHNPRQASFKIDGITVPSQGHYRVQS